MNCRTATADKRRRFLIVDDDASQLRALSRIMRAYPEIETRTAGSVGEALAVIAEWGGVDAILSDIDLGDGPDGFDLARHMQHSGVAFALASGNVDDARTARALSLGAVALYSKPFDLRDVIARLFA
jgi:CheY-like chemotaxis protein